MRIISRAEWGAHYDDGFGPRPLPATQAWLHHSVTIAPDLVPPFDDDYAAIRELERIGQSRFGAGMSYTRLFTPAGLIFEGHSIGRAGSHTANRNTVAAGYCLVGNYDTAAPTIEQLRAVAWCLQHDHAHGWLDAPRLDGGHLDLKATACPGQHAYAAIPSVNQLAAGGPISEEDQLPTPNDLWMAACVGKDAAGKTQTWPAVVWVTTMAFRIADIYRWTAELAGRDPSDIDEAAVAANLAPMLVEALFGQLSELDEEDLQRIATAVADEHARRQAADDGK